MLNYQAKHIFNGKPTLSAFKPMLATIASTFINSSRIWRQPTGTCFYSNFLRHIHTHNNQYNLYDNKKESPAYIEAALS